MQKEVKKKKIDILKIKKGPERDAVIIAGLKKQRFKVLQTHVKTEKQGYCNECFKNMDMVDVHKVKLVNAQTIFIGHCGKCGTQIYKKERKS